MGRVYRAGGQVGRVCRTEDRKRWCRGPSGARSEYATSGATPLPGEGRGLRLVQPGGRKEGEEGQRCSAGKRQGSWGRSGPPGSPARIRPSGTRAGAAAGSCRGASAASPSSLSACALVLQVYPEPRCESECLSNIREFLRGCGASLRLEVSGSRLGTAGRAWGCRHCQGLEGPVGSRGREAGLSGRGNRAEQQSPETLSRACPRV